MSTDIIQENQIENEEKKVTSVTSTVRMNSDVKEEFEEIKKSFAKGSDFAEWVIQSHRLYQSDKAEESFNRHADELTRIFKRAVQIFNDGAANTHNLLKLKDASIEKTLTAKDEQIADIQAELDVANETISSKDVEIVGQKQELKETKDVLKATQEELVKAQESLKEKQKYIDMLEKEKAQHEEISNKNNKLENEVLALKEAYEKAEKQATTDAQKIFELETEKASLIDKYNDKITSMQENYADKLKTIEEAQEQAKEQAKAMQEAAVAKAISETKDAAQAKIDKHIAREEELRDSIDKMQIEINKFTVADIGKTAEIKSLQKELEVLKGKENKNEK